MIEAESETNGLTMQLLGLARYCEGSRATEIQAIIAQLPIAAYNERTAAEAEIVRLRREIAGLKQRLSSHGLDTPTGGPRSREMGPTRLPGARRPPPPGDPYIKRESHSEVPQSPFNKHTSTRDGLADGRLSISSSSSTTLTRNPRLTPPSHSRDLFPANLSAKRQRTDSALMSRRRPVCTGCFQVNGLCDGKIECDVCSVRNYGCEYRECWDGLTCVDQNCTRIHPDQWDPVLEPGRKVNRNGSSFRR